MSPTNASVKKKLRRRKPRVVHRKKRIVSSQEHSYLKTVLSQSRIGRLSQKKKMQNLLENNKSLAQALEAAEISRQQQEQVILSLQRQLTLTNPSVIKRNLKKMGMLMQQVVNLMADTLEHVMHADDDDGEEEEEDNVIDAHVPPFPTSNVSNNFCPVPDTTPVKNPVANTQRRSLHNDLREKFGICDLTVINEDTLRLQEMTLPPILFTDGEDNTSSLRNSKRNSSRHKSSQKGRSTTSLPGRSSNTELNNTSGGGRSKSGDGRLAFEEFPQSRSLTDPSVRVCSQYDVLTTPSPKADACDKLFSSEISDSQTPKTPVLSPFVNLKAKQIPKSGIPRPVKDNLKQTVAGIVMYANSPSRPKQRRGTFVVIDSNSEKDANNNLEEVPNQTTVVSEAAESTVIGLASAGEAQHSEVILPQAARAALPLKEVISSGFDNMQKNSCMQPGVEELTVNLAQDMEFTYPVGKFLTPPETRARPEKLVEPFVVNESEQPCSSDDASDLTEIYNSETHSNVIPETAKSDGTIGIPMVNQVSYSTKLGSQSKKQASELLMDLVDNGNDETSDVTEIYNVKSYCNAPSSPKKQKDKEFPPSLGENGDRKSKETDVFAVSDSRSQVASKSKRNKYLAKIVSSPPNSGAHLQPADRRGTFVVPCEPEEQGVDFQPGPSSMSSLSRRKTTVLSSDSPNRLKNSQPEQELRGEPKSPCESPSNKNSPYRFSGKDCASVHRKSTGKVSKSSKKSPDTSRSCMLGRKKLSQLASHKSRSKKGNTTKEPTFKFFSKKSSSVLLKDAKESKTDKQNQSDVDASGPGDNQFVGKPLRKQVSDKTSDEFCVPETKQELSGSPKYSKSLQKVTDVMDKMKAASSSKSVKRKSVNKNSRGSKKAKLDNQNQKEDCVTDTLDGVSHEKGQSHRRSSLRSQNKRKSVSFRLVTDDDIFLFARDETTCLRSETGHDVAQKEVRQHEKASENISKSSAMVVQADNAISDRKECRKSLVVLEDIFNQVKASNASGSEINTDGNLQPANNIARSPVKDSPLGSKSQRHDRKNERNIADNDIVPETQVACESSEPLSSKELSKTETTQVHASNKVPQRAVIPHASKSTHKAANNENLPKGKSTSGKLPKVITFNDVQMCADGDNSKMEVVSASTENMISFVKDKYIRTTKKFDDKGDNEDEGSIANAKAESEELTVHESSESSSGKGKRSSKSDITHKGITNVHSNKAPSNSKKAKISRQSTKSSHNDDHGVNDESCSHPSVLSASAENTRNIAGTDDSETPSTESEKRPLKVESSAKSSEDETKNKRASKSVSENQNSGNDVPTESRKENVPNVVHSSENGGISLGTERESSGRSRRRTNVVSYKEPSGIQKLRRGDQFFFQK